MNGVKSSVIDIRTKDKTNGKENAPEKKEKTNEKKRLVKKSEQCV